MKVSYEKLAVIDQILQEFSAYGHRKGSCEASETSDELAKTHRLQINYLTN